MTWARPFVAITALLLAFFGFWLLINPAALEPIGVLAKDANGRLDIRATYGGLELGVAAFLAFTLYHRDDDQFLLAGVAASGFTAAGFGVCRFIGIVAEDLGKVDGQMWGFLALEAVLAAAAVHQYRALRKHQAQGAGGHHAGN